jgi:hypothetical protein
LSDEPLKRLKELLGCAIVRKPGQRAGGIFIEGGQCLKCGTNHTFTQELLIREAIRDAKHIDHIYSKSPCPMFLGKKRTLEELIAICDYIKWKNNLTEDDFE